MVTKKLPRPYLTILAALFEAGGFGDLDQHGRVTTGPTHHHLQGDALAWLSLVSHGLVAGEGAQLILTSEGRAAAAAVIAGRVREVA